MGGGSVSWETAMTKMAPGMLVLASFCSLSACTEALLGGKEYVLDTSSSQGVDGSGGGVTVSAGGGGAGASTGTESTPFACETGLTACGNACAALGSDSANCGECGHDCLGTSCNSGLCDPATVGSGLADPRNLAVDDSHVYWTTGDGKVQRVPKVGGAVETLASDQDSPGAVTVDATSVFWINEAGGKVMRVPKDASEDPKMLFKADGLRSIALDEHSMYLSRKLKKGEIRKSDKEGGSPLTLAADQPHPTDIRLLGGLLIWAGQVEPDDDVNGDGIPDGEQGLTGGYVRSMPREGGALVTLALGEGEIVALAVGAGTAVWADGTSHRIRSQTMVAGEPTTLVEGQDVRGLAADGATVLWTTSGGTLKLKSLGDGSVRLLAIDIGNAGAVTVDATHAYFLRAGAGGAVLRVAR